MLEEKPDPKTFWFREILLAKQNQTKDFLSVALEPDLLKKLSSDKLDKGITPNFRFCDKQKVLAKCFKNCYILTLFMQLEKARFGDIFKQFEGH